MGAAESKRSWGMLIARRADLTLETHDRGGRWGSGRYSTWKVKNGRAYSALPHSFRFRPLTLSHSSFPIPDSTLCSEMRRGPSVRE